MVHVEPHQLAGHVRRDDAAGHDVCMTFGGGAWACTFFMGILEYAQRELPATERAMWAYCGESAGVFYALAGALDVPASTVREIVCDMAAEGRAMRFGFLCNCFAPGLRHLHMLLEAAGVADNPNELRRRLAGRFAVSFSGLVNGSVSAYLATDFQNFDEIADAACGSGHIPIIADGLRTTLLRFPRIGGLLALDGAFTTAGCVPLLPCRTCVYAIACGSMPTESIEPHGITVDIQPAHFISQVT